MQSIRQLGQIAAIKSHAGRTFSGADASRRNVRPLTDRNLIATNLEPYSSSSFLFNRYFLLQHVVEALPQFRNANESTIQIDDIGTASQVSKSGLIIMNAHVAEYIRASGRVHSEPLIKEHDIDSRKCLKAGRADWFNLHKAKFIYVGDCVRRDGLGIGNIYNPDIAIVYVPARKDAPFIPLGDEVNPDEIIAAVSNMEGSLNGENAINFGTVEWIMRLKGPLVPDLALTSDYFCAGRFSGSPIVNLKGEIVAVHQGNDEATPQRTIAIPLWKDSPVNNIVGLNDLIMRENF